ncbi:putative E3 ubiquitin-protein ligase ariadne-2 [Lachnellula suecica]|uniref:RBR-type E3 ubiquitin transferase n=1 Tax=Lachnellula suecica TaxID=602035 RepID=A0A8T9CHX3_9HELO|nr:putative E3 ubiquitin-protein ligase ariadne-2 [Lachnellula suecica]
MDITNSQFATALRETFTCYLGFLSHTQSLRETKLPRQGKGIETTDDLASQRYFQTRVAVAEICLQYIERIASSVQDWAQDTPEEATEDCLTLEEVQNDSPQIDFAGFNDRPFIDIFSGKLIEPETPFSAGPSGAQVDDGDRGSSTEASTFSEQMLPTIPNELKPASPNLHTSPTRSEHRLGDGIHLASSDPPPEVSSYSSTRRNSPSSHYPSTTSPPSRTSDSDSASVISDMARPFQSQSQLDFELAKRIFDEEKKLAEEEDYNLAQAQRLSENWAKEEEMDTLQREKHNAQKQFADAQRLADAWARKDQTRREKEERLARKVERESSEKLRKDRETAARIQQQAEEDEAHAREAARMRAENTKRNATGKTRMFDFETEKKSKLQRERTYAQELERKRITREAARRQREENPSPGIPLQRVPRPYQQTYSSQQRATSNRNQQSTASAPSRQRSAPIRNQPSPPNRKATCVSCMEPVSSSKMATLPCSHVYCGDCLLGAFKAALSSRSPFKCCRINVPISHGSPFLSSSTTKDYKIFLIEMTTKNPIYCSSPSCHLFIPPSQIHGPIASCSNKYCKTKTCVACKKKQHKGVCAEDKEGQAVKQLGKKKGWKLCPSCSMLIERTEGCLHMTCRCDAEWCFACLRDWDVCNSTCGRR